MRSLLKASTLAALLAGCYASGGVGYRATVVAPQPAVVVETPPPPPPQPEPVVEVEYVEPAAFVYVSPQVQVIEDYDYPVFFSDGLYWRVDGGVWYSSSYHDRGWITTTTVPTYVRTIERPERFAHFRADVHARPGQIGYRAAVTTPIHHTAPPPRFVEQPGHPVHPTQGMRPGEHPVQAAQPMPPGHAEPHGMEPAHEGVMENKPMPPGHAEHAMPPGHEHEPPGHAAGPPATVAAPPPAGPPAAAAHPVGPPAGHPAPPPAAAAPPPPAAHPAPPAKGPSGPKKK